MRQVPVVELDDCQVQKGCRYDEAGHQRGAFERLKVRSGISQQQLKVATVMIMCDNAA